MPDRLMFSALLLAALAWPAAADPLPRQKADKQAVSPPIRARQANPCTAFGPGFVRVEGSDTCVKLGGGIGIGAGGSSR